MSVRVRCNKCRTAFMAADDRPGNIVPCPKCGARHKIPTTDVSEAPRVAPAPPVEVEDEVTSVFRPSGESRARSTWRRNRVLLGLLLLITAAASVALVAWPRFKPRSNDPVERVAEDYLEALTKDDSEAQRRLSVVEEPPAIRSYQQVSRDKTKNQTTKGSFAPIAALHKKIDADFAYDSAIGRFTPRHPLGAAGETLDALHKAKEDAEKSGVYDKMASGDPDDIFDAAESFGKVFSSLAEGALAPKKVLPTYKMLVEDAKPPLPAAEAALALDVARDPKTWDALLKRPFFTLKADGPFVYDRAQVDALVTDKLGSLGDPPTRLRLNLVRFRLEGINTAWRVTRARRVLPGVPDDDAEQPAPEPEEPRQPPSPPRSPGDVPSSGADAPAPVP
ncbi:MAG: hypothetical protein P4L85_09080 [Paludisphaera borealis]|uniref:hypothetical protein n=1 Tax=Paludisphaera borealis TaxID=1387353 RepID=UPI00284E70BD|nr:hypothetical protein [Paludisphaera borealis]MDR3619490.1 hypothetical protein [Paludisphaera borealis]